MSEIAYEAHSIKNQIESRIAYHTYQENRWRVRFEEEARKARPEQFGASVADAHYPHARMFEHIHALMELRVVLGLVERTIEDAKLKHKFEAAGYEAGQDAGADWAQVCHPNNFGEALRGIADGDPALLDNLPHADFSREWAGSPSWEDTYCELAEIDPQDVPEDTEDMYSVYTSAFTRGVEDKIVEVLNYRNV